MQSLKQYGKGKEGKFSHQKKSKILLAIYNNRSQALVKIIQLHNNKNAKYIWFNNNLGIGNLFRNEDKV